MIDKIGGALDPLIQAINNKLANVMVAAGITVTGSVAQVTSNPQLKSLAEIPVTEIFQHQVSAASAATYIGSAYIILQFSILIFKGIIWLWRTVRARNN